MTEPSISRLVTSVLEESDQPLTVAEIQSQVEKVRPISSRNPQATIRSAINNNPLLTTLGGRPAHYTWWPHHLTDNVFRQPLAKSDLMAGSLQLTREVWLALWPDFHAVASRRSGEIMLLLDGESPLHTRIEQLVTGQSVWGIGPTSALADWYRQQGATAEGRVTLACGQCGQIPLCGQPGSQA